jgi:hypothetical protein
MSEYPWDRYHRGDVQISKILGEGPTPWIHLPHQCDEWVIGDSNDARALIADLEKAIVEWESEEATK